jgi:transposase
LTASLKITQQQKMSSFFARPSFSESGISELVFFKVGFAVKKEVYISKCLPILQKFIQKHHKNTKIVFWPDLASADYVKNTLVQLEQLKIENVPKKENPPNVPQIRPIENVWANLKRKVYSNKYRPKDVKCLMAKIRKELESIETTGISKVMKKAPAKAQRAHKQGVPFFASNLCIV